MNYINYKEYLKSKTINKNDQILIAKTKKSYLIGPKITDKFHVESFYKRLISTSIYDIKIYKNIKEKKAITLINDYFSKLEENEVIELFFNGKVIYHKILKLPGGIYDKK